MDERLKLRATDAEDLAVMSAVLQDAVVPVTEMAYLPEERRFVMIANRFRWEDAEDSAVPGRIYERVHSGFVVDEVRAVRTRGLDLDAKDEILSLLAIEARGEAVELTFSAGVALRIEVDRILCHLDDMAEPYPTRWRPSHRLDDSGRR